MPASLLASNTFGFADGNGGHSCNLGSSPSVGDLDVLCINSDTTVSTPSGFTSGESFVNSQGSYLYYRIAAGGEGSTVTVTTSGNFDTTVSWSRWSGVSAFDQHANAHVDGSAGTTTPAVTTPTLTGTNELVVAFGALHSFPASAPTGQSWSSGYTDLTAITQGTGSNGCTGYVGYRTDAGTAAESPNVGWSNNVNDRYILVATFTAPVGSVPFSPQRVAQSRDYGEAQWLQRDRRNALLVATAANDLDVPLLTLEQQRSVYGHSALRDRRMVPQQPPQRGDMSLFATVANDLAQPLFQPADARYWHLYNDSAVRGSRPQQRAYVSDPSLLSPAVAMDPPPPPRTVQARDSGEVQWLQSLRRDPLLLTTALLENELLGGAEMDKRTNLPATHADRREVPQQRTYFDLSLLATALLESPLVWVRPQPAITDRRLVPQQRAYISDPSFYPTVAPTDPITLAWGAGGNYWHLYNDVRVERRIVPQQRQYESDPLLLTAAQLDELLGSADTAKRYLQPATHADRREVPQQRQYFDPALLLTALLEAPLQVGSFRQITTDRRAQPAQPRYFDPSLLAPAGTDPLTFAAGVGGDMWRRLNTPATHDDRRQTAVQPLRQAFYFDAGPGSPPLTLAWGVGGHYWHLYNQAAGLYARWWPPQQRQQLAEPSHAIGRNVPFASSTQAVVITSSTSGFVIVSQTEGGIL